MESGDGWRKVPERDPFQSSLNVIIFECVKVFVCFCCSNMGALLVGCLYLCLYLCAGLDDCGHGLKMGACAWVVVRCRARVFVC